MQAIRTEIVISASKEKVWEILTGFEHYHAWNPFIVMSEGRAVKGGKLRNTMLSGGKKQVFSPVVTDCRPGQRLEWLGKLPLGLFNGRHYFELEALPGGMVKLTHGEFFTGLLHKYIMKKIGDETFQNFVNMNQALKARAEAQ